MDTRFRNDPRCTLQETQAIPMCTGLPASPIAKRIKRLIDIVFCLVLVLPAFALSLCIALAIFAESRRPILFRHERIGQGGKTIRIVKFRTMVTTDEMPKNGWTQQQCEAWEKEHKVLDDPRITRVGAFLRKYSLDEIPQLFNILCGDMSLIGPRPIVREEIANYGKVFREYCLVQPGLTGLWQVSGRNDVSYARRVELDHIYITTWSPWLDCTILLRTIPTVLSGKGAY